MQVFLSWSGEKSKKVAEILYVWLPCVIQAITPFYSPEIDKGADWRGVLSDKLKNTSYGIICVTKDNMLSPWLTYEASALAEKKGNSAAIPFLFDLNRSELTGPLSAFQSVIFDRADIRRMMVTLNKACGSGTLSASVFDHTFDMWYPSLETRLCQVIQEYNDIEASGVNAMAIIEKNPDIVVEDGLSKNIEDFVNHGSAYFNDIIEIDEKGLDVNRAGKIIVDLFKAGEDFAKLFDKIFG